MLSRGLHGSHTLMLRMLTWYANFAEADGNYPYWMPQSNFSNIPRVTFNNDFAAYIFSDNGWFYPMALLIKLKANWVFSFLCPVLKA